MQKGHVHIFLRSIRDISRTSVLGFPLCVLVKKKIVAREKGRDLPQSYDKHKKTPPKSLKTQRLRTDLGRSAGVTTATQLVWLTDLRAQPSHSRNNRVIKGHCKGNKHTTLYKQHTNSHTKRRGYKIDTQTAKVINIIYQTHIQ